VPEVRDEAPARAEEDAEGRRRVSPGILRTAAAAVGAVTLSGCITVPRDAGFDTVAGAVSERTGKRAVWNRSGEDDRAAEEAVWELLQAELTTDSAVQIALLNNRSLQATYEDLGVAQADLVQAGLLRNPLFHAEIRFGAAVNPLEIGVVQSFLELFTLPLRKRVAAAAFEAAKGRVTHAALTTAHDVTAAFYRLQGAQQVLEMRQNVVAATDASADAALRLRAAGNITDLELANEQALHAQAKLALADAEAHVLDRREELAMLLGLWGPPATLWRVGSRLPELPSTDVAAAGLETLAISQRSDLAAAKSDIASAAQSLGLTSWEQLVPTIEPGLHYEREPEGTITRGPSVELSVPIFDQGQAARFGGRARLRQAQQRYAALAVEIRSRVRRARNDMGAARARAAYLSKVVLPLRRRIVAETQLRYNAMFTGVFQLLKAKQDEIDSGREYLEALTDFWVARAALEGAVGGRLARPAEGVPPSTSRPESGSPDSHDGDDR